MFLVQRRIAGILLLVGSLQFVVCSIVAAAIYPGYSASANYISDLGVWGKPSAAIFNPSIVVCGLLIFFSSLIIKRRFNLGRRGCFLGLAGVGMVLVGLFPENTFIAAGFPLIHGIGAFLAFVMGGLAAIASYKYTPSPFKIVSVILGISTLVIFSLFVITRDIGYLGLGVGGMERLIGLPTFMWVLGLSWYLLKKKV